jgi:hypothetical protein
MAFPVAAAVSAGSSILGGIFGASSADAQARDQRQALERSNLDTFLAATDAWNFNEANSRLNFDFATESAKLAFEIERAVELQRWETSKALDEARYVVESTNNDMQWRYQDAAQKRDFDFTRTMQAAEQRQQIRLYEASEKTYSQNTQLISQAAGQSYRFEQNRLRFERAGIDIKGREQRVRFDADKTQATRQAKQIEARYRTELRQAGFTGEALQLEVKKRMQQFTGQQDQARREASREAAGAAATGKQGATATRMMQDPFSQSDLVVGALGVELAFFGQEQQIELLKLAEATNLAGQLADIDREQIYSNLDTSARMTNLALEDLNLTEREAIFRSNNQIDDIGLQARSQMNEAESNRELKPLSPVNIPAPLPIPKTMIPKPFEMPKPLMLAPGVKPFLPNEPMSAPRPRMGSPVPSLSSGAGGILAQGIFSAAGSIINGFNSRPPATGNLNPIP